MKKHFIVSGITTLLAGVGIWVDLLIQQLTPFLQIAIATTLGVVLVAHFVFLFCKKESLSKLCLTIIALITVVVAMIWGLEKLGFFEKVKDEASLQDFLESFGNWAFIMFFLLQFFQVLFAPIPATVTIAAGTIMFGFVTGSLISLLAITCGSVVAFLIGQKFGFKVVKWIVGEENLQKGLKLVKGKDRVAITLMFLFPFFPDDLLCFVAGMTTIKLPYFTGMVVLSRIITVTSTGGLVKLLQWLLTTNLALGIIVIAVGVIAIIAVFVLAMKNADRIEAFIDKLAGKFKKKKAKS